MSCRQTGVESEIRQLSRHDGNAGVVALRALWGNVGLQTALVRRGPWGRIPEELDITAQCLFTIPDLTTLPQPVRDHNLRQPKR